MSNRLKLSLSVGAALAFLMTAMPSMAEGMDHNHKHEPQQNKPIDESGLTISPNEAVIVVHGIVCSFCSEGVQRKLSKLPFIDTTKYKKGVKVDIEEQRVTIALKPDAVFDIDQVFEAVKSGGYEPVKAYLSDGKGGWTVHQGKGA